MPRSGEDSAAVSSEAARHIPRSAANPAGRGKASERLRHARIHRAARTELRRAHADAGAVAQLVDAVEHVEHRKPSFDLAEQATEIEVLRRRRVDLRVA